MGKYRIKIDGHAFTVQDEQGTVIAQGVDSQDPHRAAEEAASNHAADLKHESDRPTDYTFDPDA